MRIVAWLWILALAGCFDVPALPPGDPSPSDCTDCTNDAFCDGIERCEDGVCLQGSSPCASGLRCDEATDQCLPATDATPPITMDGGPTADVGMPVDAGPAADAGSADCCEGMMAPPCHTARCVADVCIFDAADDATPCGVNHECRAGQCVPRCETFLDCEAPPGACMRATCDDGVCGVADCPGDVCRPDGCPPCGDNGNDCGAAAPCQQTNCIEGLCATLFDTGAACDDGDVCFGADRCDAAGTCQPGNVALCAAGGICAPELNDCLPAPECSGAGDCRDGDRQRCVNQVCVQCEEQADCADFPSPLCQAGECVCDDDLDCAHLDEEACRFDGDCARTGVVQRGFCEGRGCVARNVVEQCRRATDGNACDNLAGICHDEICGPADALISVTCPAAATHVRIDCDNIPRVNAGCGFQGTMNSRCARGAEVRICCNSDTMFSCQSPPLGVAVANMVLQIQPALADVVCVGPMPGTHRVCTGLLFEQTAVTCAPSN